MKAVVLYQSRRGNTRRAGELIGEACLRKGIEASIRPATNPDHRALAEADVVFVGTWVGGIVIAGHHPGQTGKLSKLPALYNKDTAVFMTYKWHAGKVLDSFAGWLHRNKGAEVHHGALIKSGAIEADGATWADAFVNETLSKLGVRVKG
ncbi:MAG: hypothetical protein HKN26_10275 [Acidimicrobiales bacterium]|nr:hypothetical protein [Acidimicrobiales bacterium]